MTIYQSLTHITHSDYIHLIKAHTQHHDFSQPSTNEHEIAKRFQEETLACVITMHYCTESTAAGHVRQCKVSSTASTQYSGSKYNFMAEWCPAFVRCLSSVGVSALCVLWTGGRTFINFYQAAGPLFSQLLSRPLSDRSSYQTRLGGSFCTDWSIVSFGWFAWPVSVSPYLIDCLTNHTYLYWAT